MSFQQASWGLTAISDLWLSLSSSFSTLWGTETSWAKRNVAATRAEDIGVANSSPNHS